MFNLFKWEYNKCFIEPIPGFFCALMSYPKLRTGLFRLNHICSFEEEILKGLNLNNLGLRRELSRTV